MDATIITAAIAAIPATVAATAAWRAAQGARKDAARDRERLAQKIEVMLSSGQRTRALFSITRSELSRAEVLGRLGMVPLRNAGTKERFSIASLSRPAFVSRIDELKAGSGTVLEIHCSDVEFEQFA